MVSLHTELNSSNQIRCSLDQGKIIYECLGMYWSTYGPQGNCSDITGGVLVSHENHWGCRDINCVCVGFSTDPRGNRCVACWFPNGSKGNRCVVCWFPHGSKWSRRETSGNVSLGHNCRAAQGSSTGTLR